MYQNNIINENKIIEVSKRHESYGNDEFYCEITNKLDNFNKCIQDIDYEYRNIMRTYIMPPEDMCGKVMIPIRVPGATRGHIEVIADNKYWKVTEVKLYEDSAIIGISNIGCYEPEVLNILSEFNGMLINFHEYSPNNGGNE
jgi:hypothetical protein